MAVRLWCDNPARGRGTAGVLAVVVCAVVVAVVAGPSVAVGQPGPAGPPDPVGQPESGGPPGEGGGPEAEGPEVDKEIEGEADEELEGRRIATYELVCDLDLCRDSQVVERFKRISGLAVGDVYRHRQLVQAQQRLAQTGFFSELTVDRSLDDDGVRIDIEATGAVLIRRVEFEGLSPPPFEDELRNLLIYRPGQVYVEDEEQARAQLSSLESVFEEEGYFGTRIAMQPRRVDGESHLVDLVFEVEPGHQRRICAMAFRGLRAMSSAEARELMLSSASIFARRVPVSLPGFTTDGFRDGREALIEEYRRRGYFRARIVDHAIQVDEATNCVQLIVDVNEGPFWDIKFEGNEGVDTDRLREQMPFGDSGYVDDNEIRVAQHAVRQLYEAEGYPFADVQGREEGDDRHDRRLIFVIDEGPQAQINEIRFDGMEAFDEDEILAEFGTRPFGFLEAGGYLQTEQLLADFDHLEQRYREEGYLQAIVEEAVIRLDDQRESITIEITVDEGRQTVVDGVELAGFEEVSEETLRELLELEDGSPFRALEMQADQSRIARHYGSIGRPDARIETSCRDGAGREVACEAPGLPEGCEYSTFEQFVGEGCQWRDDDSSLVCRPVADDEDCRFERGIADESVTLRYDIDEGSRVEVGEILLKGNFRTRSGVIFRELPLESGDTLNVEKLLEGQGNMRSLGLFNSVSIETIGLDERPGPGTEDSESEQEDRDAGDRSVPIIVSVEESRSQFLDFRFGVEGRELLDDSRRLLGTGELQYIDDNLFGTGQRFRPRLIGAADTLDMARLGRDTARDFGAASDITEMDYLVGAELIYSHPRFLRSQTGIDELFLTVTPFYMLDLLGVTADQVLREEWGLRLELRKELVEIMDQFYATLRMEAKQASTWESGDLRIDGERIFSPRRATGKLAPELSLDRRDSPLNPSDGYHLQLQPELVSGDALSEGEDIIGDSYWRLSFSASHFWSPSDGLTIGQGLDFGQVVPLFDRQELVPPDELYRLGGVGTVRGFPGNSLGPRGSLQQATGGEFKLNYSAELRYPLVEEWGLYGSTFFDAGLLVDCFDDGDRRSSSQCYRNAFPEEGRLDEIRTAAGIGLRYLLVDQIPLLLDYGMVLNRRPAEGFGSLHFNLGYTF